MAIEFALFLFQVRAREQVPSENLFGIEDRIMDSRLLAMLLFYSRSPREFMSTLLMGEDSWGSR